MTLQEAIARIDMLKPSTIPDRQKIAWISDLDGMVWREIYLAHEGVDPRAKYEGYNEETPGDTVLMVPEPYTDVYQHYLATQMDIVNMENQKYTQDKILFNASYNTFSDYWTRTHMPLTRVKQWAL